MTTSSDDDKNTRAIEKLRSWKEISKSAEQTVDPSPDDYATELELFEQREIDKALWAKHLVEMRGNEEEAKWNYIKERVTTAPARRAELEKLEQQRLAKLRADQQAREAAEAERRRRAAEKEKANREAAEAERWRKAVEEQKANREAADKARQERVKLLGEENERQRERAEKERKIREAAERERKGNIKRLEQEERVRRRKNAGGQREKREALDEQDLAKKDAEVQEKLRAFAERERNETAGQREERLVAESEWEQIKSREHASKSSDVGPSPDGGSPLREGPDATKGSLHESNSWFKTRLGYLGLFVLSILFVLAMILDDDPSDRVVGQEEIFEAEALILLKRSYDQFYGVTGIVEERTAASSALLALEKLETLDSDLANSLRDAVNLWLANILSCASNPLVRDLDGANKAKREISDLSESTVRATFFWDAYWGEAFPQGSLNKSAYLELKNEIDQAIAEWGVNGQSDAILINTLERSAEILPGHALSLAEYYECRIKNQEFELASDWYVRALENAKKTLGSDDPTSKELIQETRLKLERLRKVISATYLQ